MNSVKIENVSFVYSKDTPFEKQALSNVDIDFPMGKTTGIIGHTGSGKSTISQMINGLLKPTSGNVYVGGRNIWENPKKIKEIRFMAGLVFQYPEYQLFEETVKLDIEFGPKNMGLSKEEIEQRVLESAKLVGIDESMLDKSPFDLSGGQKRRVAIAGIMAMKPSV
ncbi:MAG: ATP-binding cassette domain-containing protein, partial [Clostridia bacterium]|nr:ATP-binding cassette domain-containing protein [Clostridia bacterium]